MQMQLALTTWRVAQFDSLERHFSAVSVLAFAVFDLSLPRARIHDHWSQLDVINCHSETLKRTDDEPPISSDGRRLDSVTSVKCGRAAKKAPRENGEAITVDNHNHNQY